MGLHGNLIFIKIADYTDHASFFSTSAAWGLFTQTQTNSTQSADIGVKFGTAHIKNIVLAAPDSKTGSNISVVLNGAKQSIESSKQTENTIAIHLKSACKVNAGSNLIVSFELEE